MAARAVLAGVATGTPKAGDGRVEMIRMLKIARDSAVKARAQSLNQIRALLVTAPAELRESLAGLTVGRLLDRCAAFRPGVLDSPRRWPGTVCDCSPGGICRLGRRPGNSR